MSNTLDTFKSIAETFTTEATKFYDGNNSAGTRARKALQELIKYARTERKAIQEAKVAIKAAK
jgi:DNA invertase Pin-like site-specific DNA recombinase